MSNFKRLANVARGKIKTALDSIEEGLSNLSDPGQEALPKEPVPQNSEDRRRQMLDDLLASGLLSEAEHRSKVQALDTESPPEPDEPSTPRVQPTPKKRTL